MTVFPAPPDNAAPCAGAEHTGKGKRCRRSSRSDAIHRRYWASPAFRRACCSSTTMHPRPQRQSRPPGGRKWDSPAPQMRAVPAAPGSPISLKDKKWGPASKVPLWFSLAAFAADSTSPKKGNQKKKTRHQFLMSGSLKALTLRQLNYASASRSTDTEQGRQQHEIAEVNCTLANYPGPQ